MISLDFQQGICRTHRIRSEQAAGSGDGADVCPTFVEVDGVVVIAVNNTSTTNTSKELR